MAVGLAATVGVAIALDLVELQAVSRIPVQIAITILMV